MLSPGFNINNTPPTTNAEIIMAPINLKNPDLFVKSVVTEENIIKINVRK